MWNDKYIVSCFYVRFLSFLIFYLALYIYIYILFLLNIPFYFRCYYVAESFLKLEKWAEALLLYERTLTYIKSARNYKLEVRIFERILLFLAAY